MPESMAEMRLHDTERRIKLLWDRDFPVEKEGRGTE